MQDLTQQLIEAIIELASERGLKQKDLAEQAGMGADALSRLKKARDVRLSTLQQLGEVLGKKLVWVDDSDDVAARVSRGELF